MRSVARVELRKLTAQLPLRLLVLVCLLGPFAFALLTHAGNGSPTDPLFGVWLHTSGYAVSLVVLGFAGSWGFPIVAGVLAGDLFAAEDRHGTWKTLLSRSRSLRELFAGKVLAALVVAALLGTLVAAASLAAGVIVAGAHPLVDLGGRERSPLALLLLVGASWLICLLPVLVYTSIALCASALSRNGIVGVLAPVLVALLCALIALVSRGVVVELLLPGAAFDAWHGLFTAHVFLGPVVVSALICLAWIVGSLTLAWRVLARREFAAGAEAGRGWRRSLRLPGGALLVVALLILASGWGPAAVTRTRLSADFTRQFHRLTLRQQDELGHPIPRGSQYRILPVCVRRGAAQSGPGEWTCTMNVYVVLPGAAQPLTNTPVPYDLSVAANGCYKAQAPATAVGAATLRSASGAPLINPLAIIYGCVNIL